MTMTRGLLAAALAMLLAAPAAFGQPAGSGASGDTGASTAAGGGANAGTEQLRLTGLPPELRQSLEPRLAPNQRVDELVETTLLNQLGRLGFARLNWLHRDGDSYIAEVVTTQGQTATYRINPITGELTQLR